jgi:putative transcriptional regulator
MTEKERHQAAMSDPDAIPMTEEELENALIVPRVRTLRRALELTQEEFSRRYGIPLGTLRDWEQGRVEPDQATRSYLTLIARDPEAVYRLLKRKRMDGKTIMEVVKEAAYDAKVDEDTMRKLEALVLPEVQDFTPDEIRHLRESTKLSRSFWAKMLNVGVTTVQKWESGETHPDGAALKLLNLVQTHGIGPLI